MALLTPEPTPAETPPTAGDRTAYRAGGGAMPGSAAVLTVHGRSLPQPDQLCGPFSAHLALHALLSDPPGLVSLAQAAGTVVWPHDVPAWRPQGAPLDRTGWDVLPHAPSPETSGTDAAGLTRAVGALTAVRVVAAAGAGDLDGLLASLVAAGRPVGVLANVRTGPLGLPFDVGHFVVVHAWHRGRVGVADTYAELGAPSEPPGCRWVATTTLLAALTAPPGRGLLLLVAPTDEPATRVQVAAAGFTDRLWTT